MGWIVRLRDRARKDLKKSDRRVAIRILRFFHERIEGGNDPRSIGDWRAVCSIQDETILVLVLTARHRNQVYQ